MRTAVLIIIGLTITAVALVTFALGAPAPVPILLAVGGFAVTRVAHLDALEERRLELEHRERLAAAAGRHWHISRTRDRGEHRSPEDHA